MADLAELILELVRARGSEKSICPSEVARAANPDHWRQFMEPVRQAARELCHQGLIEICQGGEPVDPDHFRGPVRLRVRS
ncbi:MAG: DUF3253 domain-containing protein [Vulcanimicrobiota bacterium]